MPRYKRGGYIRSPADARRPRLQKMQPETLTPAPPIKWGYQRAKRYPGHEKKSTVGTLAVLSLVFGVLSVLFLIFTNHFGLLAIAGLILGIAALVKHEHVILSVLGVIFSGFVLLIGLFWFVLPFFYYF